MKKIVYPVLTAIFVATLLVSTAGAGGYKLSSSTSRTDAEFVLGSLITRGSVSGIGGTDWFMTLKADGHASVVCVNNGSNPVPGQSSPKVEGKATQKIPLSQITKNGKAPFNVEAKPLEETPGYVLTGLAGGCPNDNWSAYVDFVYWDHAVIRLLLDPDDPTTVVATWEYFCETTRTGPNDTQSTFDDGMVSCRRVLN
jgi:hypothetical protein